MPDPTRRPVFYVLSTHWDREWYLPFQAFRQRMVIFFDRILEGFASGSLKGPLTLDGQCIPVEDYLEVRPERREEFLEHIRKGRIRLGPWYVMPDEFLVSGESLIRNLRLGRSLAREYGGNPSNVGFLCDMFGHTGQMPQIFAGFGIRSGFLWRGTNNFDVRHLRWQGADGSELLCYRRNYCDFSFQVRRAGEPATKLTPEAGLEHLKSYVGAESAATALDPVLLFDGGDHQAWDEAIYPAILAYRSEAQPDGIIHTDLDGYFDVLLKDRGTVPTVLKGELREPSRHAPPDDDQWMIPGCLASRVWIKQQNAACEHLLTAWAEPFCVFAGAEGNGCGGFLDVAWRWLLQNHPHDSMGGCSIDQVHEDMRYRFSQSHQIAENVTREATHKIAVQVGEPLEDGSVRCVLFNALPTALKDEVVEIDLPIPAAWKEHPEAHNFDFQPNFRLFNEDGKEIAWTKIALKRNQERPLLRPSKFPQLLKVHIIRVVLQVDLPACGYVTLTAKENRESLQVRHPRTLGIAVDDRTLDNGTLRVEVLPSGEVAITDLRSGQVYRRVLGIEDSGDVGDGWCHAAPFQDETYSSVAANAQVALVLNTGLAGRIRIAQKLEIPAAFDQAAGRRSEERTTLVVEHHVTLRHGSEHVEVETRIDNTARDHRVRVLFPSHAREATHWLADAAFDVVERSIALREDNHLYRELEVETKPMQTWMAVHGASHGLAVVTEGGLLEGTVRDLPERPLALTLFRSTRRTVFTEGEPGGQLLGPLKFRYAIVPLQGAPERVKLAMLARKLAGAVRIVTFLPEEEQVHRKADQVGEPLSRSFLSVEGDLVISSFRHVGDALELRLFNPATKPAGATVTFGDDLRKGWPPQSSQAINFEGNAIGEAVSLVSGKLTVKLNPKQIASYRVAW